MGRGAAGAGMSDHPHAEIHIPRGLRLIWLIPVVAALLALYLGWQAWRERGPTITVTWHTAEGLIAGQTKVKYKAVELGTVDRITLSDDLSHVVVRIRMRREAEPLLTEDARIWVVRARFAEGNVSGLDTLLSGAFIVLDPSGARSPTAKLAFTGLEDPPAVRSDEPGATFVLNASQIGSLSAGSPLFFHDIPAGEVLRYQLDPNQENVTLHIFIRAPFDALVRRGSRFWNSSGVAVDFGAQGVRVRLNSLSALINGGISFDTPAAERAGPKPAPDAVFPLYADEARASASGYRDKIKLLTRFEGSVRGLAAGAPVEIYGIQIGEVTDVKLDFEPSGARSQVTVRFEVQPERMSIAGAATPLGGADSLTVARRLVARGLRMQLDTTNLITGQMALTMRFVPGAPSGEVGIENDELVLPSQAGGFERITDAAGNFVNRLNNLPLDGLVAQLQETLKGASSLTNGPELREAILRLNETLVSARDMARAIQAGVGPAAKQLPLLTQGVQAALDHTNRLIGSVDSGYGAGSPFARDLDRLLAQIGDAARSMRLLADYLNAHPDSLLRGRDGGGK